MSEERAYDAAVLALQERGYAVLVQPTLANIAYPEGFRPDLMGVRGDDVIAVEIKGARERTSAAHLTESRRFAESQGWSFWLWRGDDTEAAASMGANADEAEAVTTVSEEPSAAPGAWLAVAARLEAALAEIHRKDRLRTQTRELRLAERSGVEGARVEALPTSSSWLDVLSVLAREGFVEPAEYTLTRDVPARARRVGPWAARRAAVRPGVHSGEADRAAGRAASAG